jgi:hypothetical protein
LIQIFEAKRTNLKPDFPEDFPTALKGLIIKGWSKKPKERPRLGEFKDSLNRMLKPGTTKAPQQQSINRKTGKKKLHMKESNLSKTSDSTLNMRYGLIISIIFPICICQFFLILIIYFLGEDDETFEDSLRLFSI